MTLRIGELFAGVGGLGMGVTSVLGGEIAWFSEIDPAPSRILAHHWPNTPNLGDITQIDWATVPPVDVLTGGFPCQDVSLAGARAGLKNGTRSGLWTEFARAIKALQPRLVVIENVRGLLSATASGGMEPDPWGVGDGATRPVVNALGVVLGVLASLGYDARWCGIRAADAGAPHGRYRVFIIAENADVAAGDQRWIAAPDETQSGRSRADSGRRSGTPAPHPGRDEPERWGRPRVVGSAPATSETDREERQRIWNTTSDRSAAATWGVYAPAIERWERVLGRTSPAATNPDGKNGSHRLSAQFVEFLMGLPAGHVTDPAINLTRNQQLKALGNGVVPQQAALALRHLLKGVNA